MARALWLTLLVLLLPGGATGQPPAKPAGPPTLDTTPLPPDAIIVICENLGQAVGKMQPGSIILSPQRYEELIGELNRLRKQTQAAPREVLFHSCRISGNVKQPSIRGRAEFAELQLDYEVHTELANTRIVLPLRGLSLLEAELDGKPPSWGPLDQPLSIIVPEAKQHKLRLRGRVPVRQVGPEHRLLIEQLPAASVTNLDLRLPGRIAAARLAGQDLLETGSGSSESRLTAEGLGTLNRLELTWRTEEADTTTSPVLAVTSEQRFLLDSNLLEADARLRLELSKGRLEEIEIELPGDTLDPRAELLPADLRRVEPPELLVTTSPRLWRVRFRQPLTTADGLLTLRLRWQQRAAKTPESPWILRPARLVRPANCWQAGTMQVSVSPEVQAQFQNKGGLRTEVAQAEARGPVQAFRFGPHGMELQVQCLGAAATTVAEARWNGELRVEPRRLRLTAELEILRVNGGELAELELSMPRGWTLDRRLLLHPFVRDLEQREDRGTLRIVLASRLPSTFNLRLELELATGGLNRAQWDFPRLLSSVASSQAKPCQWVIRTGKLQVAVEQVTAQWETGTQGLMDDKQCAPELETSLKPPETFLLLADEEPYPRLALAWRPLLPTYRLEGRAYLFPEQGQLEQDFQLHWVGKPLEALTFHSTSGSAEPPNVEVIDSPDGTTSERLNCTATAHSPTGKITELSVRLPKTSGSSLLLRVRSSTTFRAQDSIALPWWSPAPGQARQDGAAWLGVWTSAGWEVQGLTDGSWRPSPAVPVESRQMPQLSLAAIDGSPPPAFRAVAAPTVDLIAGIVPRQCLETLTANSSRRRFCFRALLTSNRLSALDLLLQVPRDRLQIESVHVDRSPCNPPAYGLVAGGDATKLRIPLDPKKLGTTLSVEIHYSVARNDTSSFLNHWLLPMPHWPANVRVELTRWRVEGLSQRALVTASAQLEPGLSSWWARSQPRLLRGAFGEFLPAVESRLSEPEQPALAFATNGPSVDLALWHAPEAAVAMAGSLGITAAGMVAMVASAFWRRLWIGLLLVGVVAGMALAPNLMVALVRHAWPGVAAVMLLGVWYAWRGRIRARHELPTVRRWRKQRSWPANVREREAEGAKP